MKNLVGDSNWQLYQNLMGDAHATFNQDTFIWRRHTGNIERYGEDGNQAYEDVEIKALIQGNVYYLWPITKTTDSGELDDQNMSIFLNREYLSQNGYLTSEGNLDFDLTRDYFIHRGTRYKVRADTLTSQAYDDPQHIFIVLTREEVKTGNTRDDRS